MQIGVTVARTTYCDEDGNYFDEIRWFDAEKCEAKCVIVNALTGEKVEQLPESAESLETKLAAPPPAQPELPPEPVEEEEPPAPPNTTPEGECSASAYCSGQWYTIDGGPAGQKCLPVNGSGSVTVLIGGDCTGERICLRDNWDGPDSDRSVPAGWTSIGNNTFCIEDPVPGSYTFGYTGAPAGERVRSVYLPAAFVN